MSSPDAPTLVRVTVPVTFEMTVAVPAAAAGHAEATASALAAHAAEQFAHVSRNQILAFNVVNRIHLREPGEVADVATGVGPARQTGVGPTRQSMVDTAA